MSEYDLLVLNGVIVTDQETGEFDIAVKDGKIAKVVPRGSLNGAKATKTIDAEGGMIMVRRMSHRMWRTLTDEGSSLEVLMPMFTCEL